MFNQLTALIVDESKWLPVAMGLALIVVAIMLYRHRRSDLPARRLVLATMNLFFGVMIGTMAFGHLLAVSVKLTLGTLQGSVTFFYMIGTALTVPCLLLVNHTRRILDPNKDHGQATVALNVWLAVTLLILGIHNLPLAAPAFFNIGYQMHSRRIVGWAILSVATVVNVGLFIGSLIFMASGQSFEQFSGME